MNTADSFKLADIHLRGVDQSMRSVESKASTLLTISLALFSFSLTVLPQAISVFKESISLGGKMILIGFLVILFFCIYSILSIIGIHKLIKVISPKLTGANKSDKKSLIYFEDFKHLKMDIFREKWHQLSPNDVMDEVIDRIYYTGLILSYKYKTIKEAVILLEWAGLFAICFILLVYLVDINLLQTK